MRKLKEIILLFFITAASCMNGCASPKGVDYTADGYSLNTYVKVTLYGCGSQKIAEEAIEICSYYEDIFSRTSADSRLYELNEKGFLDIKTEEDRQLAGALELALRYCEMTEGALDITVEPLSVLWDFGGESPSVPGRGHIEDALERVDYRSVDVGDERIELNGARIDLGAFAKGYIADRIKEYLEGEGIGSALIYLGGNVLCIGKKPDGRDFRIGVQRPFGEADDVMCALKASDLSVVTSGVYERFFYEDSRLYHHILDPKTGFPCDNGLLSVTIIAEDSGLCDALSTACFVMGQEKALNFVNGLDGVCAVFVDSDYKLIYSEGAEDFTDK